MFALCIHARVLAGQQQVQQQAERVDICGRRDGVAVRLLRRGVLRREHAPAIASDLGGLRRRIFGIEQLGDAEIEQLDLPRGIDHHVAGFQVAVHDELRVRMLHRLQHLTEERKARALVQPPRVAKGIDALAGHMLEHEVGLALLGDPGIDEARDVRVRQPRQDRALAPEARGQRALKQAGVQQLDRRAGLEAPVAAFSQPDRAHAALAQRLEQRIGADALADQQRRCQR